MYLERQDEIKKREDKLSKKESIIEYKKTRLLEMSLNKLNLLLKKNIDIGELSLEWEEEKRTFYNSDMNTCPNLQIIYKGHEISIDKKGEFNSIGSWYKSYSDEDNNWFEYGVIIGIISKQYVKGTKFKEFMTRKFKELSELYIDRNQYKKELDSYKEETKILMRGSKKEIIKSLIYDGMRMELSGNYIGEIRNASSLIVESEKNKTYKCSIFGVKDVNFSFMPVNDWYDSYVKKDDLCNIILNNQDNWSTDFKRKFNLKMAIDE